MAARVKRENPEELVITLTDARGAVIHRETCADGWESYNLTAATAFAPLTSTVEFNVKIFGANTPLWGKRPLKARTGSPAYAGNFDRCSRHRLFDTPISDAAG